jgi:hypothetical protein
MAVQFNSLHKKAVTMLNMFRCLLGSLVRLQNSIERRMVPTRIYTNGRDTFRCRREIINKIKVTMVNAMVRRRVENPLQRSQLSHQFRVDPKLVDQIQLDVHQELSRWNEQSQWQVKYLFQEIVTKF